MGDLINSENQEEDENLGHIMIEAKEKKMAK